MDFTLIVDVKYYREQRNRGIRTALLSSLSLVVIFVIYSKLSAPRDIQMLDVSSQLGDLANIVLVWTFISIAVCIWGAYAIFKAETARAHLNGNKLGTYLMVTFSGAKYWRIMVVSSILYWILFGFLSQILLYNPEVSFEEDGVVIPSIVVTPCCNLPGYVPMLSAYLTDHFVILIIPANFALSVGIAALVGFNIALIISVFNTTKSMSSSDSNNNKKLSVMSGIGITTGLFVGCPTCAGSLISLFAGFGAGMAVSALAPFQTLFLLISFPTLIISPFIISKFMKDSFACNFRTSSVGSR